MVDAPLCVVAGQVSSGLQERAGLEDVGHHLVQKFFGAGQRVCRESAATDPVQRLEISGRPRLANARHEGDLSPSRDRHLALSTHRVFVSDEALLDVSFPVARARLAGLIRGGLLSSASAEAYSEGITGLPRLGPPGSAPGLPRLVQVRVQDLTATAAVARVALRWEVAEPAGGLFPALDADITLAPAGERASTLTLTGVYRLPPGTAGPELDRAILLGCATATIQTFLHSVLKTVALSCRSRNRSRRSGDTVAATARRLRVRPQLPLPLARRRDAASCL